MKKTPILLLLCLLSFAYTHANIRLQLTPSNPNDAEWVQLDMVDEDIIHVQAGKNDGLEARESLIIQKNASKKVKWSLRQNKKEIRIKTNKLRVYLDRATGSIRFTDRAGNTLLQESVNGKHFTPTKVDGQTAYSIQQVFASPHDEAFFGLGQHQSEILNYKGKNEQLFQYNTKVSVPMVLSNKGYGILWDNYSLTRFGDPRPYSNLNQFQLYNKQGIKGGLTATYLEQNDPEKPFVVREENSLDYENLESIQRFPMNFNFNNARIRWEGYIQSEQTGLHAFLLYYAGYTRVFLDHKPVVEERWRTAWNPSSYPFEFEMQAGKKHHIRIEWEPDGGASYIGLKALTPRPDAEKNALSLWSEMGRSIDYYFIYGPEADDVVQGYRQLTGKAQVMPKWSMGFWQSRERYKTQKELLETLQEFRQRNIPIDNIVQDWSYWEEDQWGSHAFDSVRFPDPKAMVEEVHDSSARIMLSVWPKFYHNTTHYKALDQQGWIYQQAIQDSIKDWIGSGYIGSFYDAFSAGARDLFWKQMEQKLMPLGFDAWWMDASEPDILSNASMDYRKKLMNPTALGSSTEYFNAYGLMNAKGIYEGQRQSGYDQRIFLLTRSGFAGSQRYAACIWSGDIGTRWEDMRAQITAGLNFSISGNPYWTMDNGGFCVEKRYEKALEGSEDKEEWRELNVRWHQFGAFVPLFRSHGQYPKREPWNIAPEQHPAYAAYRYYNQLRYRLLPYIYTLAGQCYFQDDTMMRPLVMDFTNDSTAINLTDQYMFGSALLICPITTYKARERSVYFPEETPFWYDLYSGNVYKGGMHTIVDAPYDRMPVFVKAGSILPVGSLIQHTKTPQNDLDLFVYAGQDGSFDLYEDDGTTYGYESGQFSRIRIEWDDSKQRLMIKAREGQFPNMAESRNLRIRLIRQGSEQGMDHQTQSFKDIHYTGKAVKIKW